MKRPKPCGYKYHLQDALVARHNALIADQAAEALNDFAAALSLLCRHPRPFSSHAYDGHCGFFPYQALLRGLG